MKPVIGVMPLVDTEKDSLWMLPGYLDAITQTGGIPIMFPLTEDTATLQQLCRMCDGFLLTGGQDVSPSLYGEATLPVCGECSAARDKMEQIVLNYVLSEDKPLLGICRGIQIINVLLGGTLYQNLPTQHPSSLEHHQTPPYDVPVHKVILEPDSPLAALLGKTVLSVNSYHHQGIKALAPDLIPMAYATDDLIEAVCLKNQRFFWALQWHPEFCYHTDEDNRKIVAHFIANCQK